MPIRLALLIYVSLASAWASEGFWPLHSIPVEKIKAETGVELSKEWIERAMRSAAQLRLVNSGGSGAVVSRHGLVVTNRHVIVEYLGSLSPAGKNYVRDGFLAARREDEIPCPGLRVRTLTAQVKVDAARTEELKRAAGRDELRLRRQIEQTESIARGQICEVVALYGGSEYWIYCYRESGDVRLVYAPDEGLGDFGGRADNFSYPRHEVDVTFLRLYAAGVPLLCADYLEWSDRTISENEPVFPVGHAAENERDAPLSYVRYLAEHKLPAQAALFGSIVAALDKRLATAAADGADAGAIDASLHRMQNRHKLSARMAEILAQPDTLARLQKREDHWRGVLKVPQPWVDCEKACESMRANAALAEVTDVRTLRALSAWKALLRFAEHTEGMAEDATLRARRNTQAILQEALLSVGYVPAVEECLLAGHIAAMEKLLPPENAFRAVLLKDTTAADFAARLARESKLFSAEGCLDLLKQGSKAIGDSKDPALQFARTYSRIQDELVRVLIAHGQRDAQRLSAVKALRRAQAEAAPGEEAPETNRTARVAVGRAEGAKTPRPLPWTTTFRTQLEKSVAMGETAPYRASPLLKKASEAELGTLLNFVTTADGGPGTSGAPVLDKNARIVGVQFDGNAERVASLYYYAPPETGARSIAIHSEAVLLALKLAGAQTLIDELLPAKK